MKAMGVTLTLKPKIEGLEELEETLQEVQSAIGYVLVKLEEAKAAALRVEAFGEPTGGVPIPETPAIDAQAAKGFVDDMLEAFRKQEAPPKS